MCLSSLGAFVVMPPILNKSKDDKDFRGNEIRYFGTELKDRVKLLQPCLQSNFNNVTFTPSQLNLSNAAPGTAAEIEVWILEYRKQLPYASSIPYSPIYFEYDSDVLQTRSYPTIEAISADLRSRDTRSSLTHMDPAKVQRPRK